MPSQAPAEAEISVCATTSIPSASPTASGRYTASPIAKPTALAITQAIHVAHPSRVSIVSIRDASFVGHCAAGCRVGNSPTEDLCRKAVVRGIDESRFL
jgi:hypothetical protein